MNGLLRINGYDNPERKADIIFVHGLGGDPFDTWRHKNDASEKATDSWPYWLDRDFPEVAVWTIAYSSSSSVWTGYTMPLVDRATQILDAMANKDLGNRPLMFICHSLGGLVVKQVLRLSNEAVSSKRKKQVIENTRVVMFLATPHDGVRINWFFSLLLKLLGSTITIDEICRNLHNLLDLSRWYCDYARALGIETATYRESRRFWFLSIVDANSSDPRIGPCTPLDENHISIAKPLKSDNQICEGANRLVKEYLIKSTSQKKIFSQLFSPIQKNFPAKHIEEPSEHHSLWVCHTKYNILQQAEKIEVTSIPEKKISADDYQNGNLKREIAKQITDDIQSMYPKKGEGGLWENSTMKS